MKAEEDIREKLFREQTCLKCSHFAVCYYYRAALQLFPRDEEIEKFRPFGAEELAKICRFYAPDLV